MARGLTLITLLLLAALAGQALDRGPRPAPPVPDAATLLTATGWTVAEAYPPGQSGMAYRLWRLRGDDGGSALLYLGATSRAQTAFTWSGQLGFLGEGYVVASEQTVALPGSASSTGSLVRVYRNGRAEMVASAVIRPDGVVGRGADRWDLLAVDAFTRSGPYYAVRLSAPDQGDKPERRLTTLLATLVQRIR